MDILPVWGVEMFETSDLHVESFFDVQFSFALPCAYLYNV